MVHFPVLTELRVTDYELFPGDPPGSGIRWQFREGVTVIAGINGLGKTTLLLMILRSLTGRYDLSSDGVSQSLRVVLPEEPARLNARQLRAFQNRVSDGAENARVVLSATVGGEEVAITRRLKNLVLESLVIGGRTEELPPRADAREAVFQSRMMELIGLGSFVDVLVVLHHVMLFLENRPGALWDPNAQRQLLRALCLSSEDARRVAALEREVQSTDSQARNVHARMDTMEKRLDEALELEADVEGVRAELAAEQELLDAELGEAERLERALGELDERRREVRLAHERAKIVREEAVGALERVKYRSLLTYFPSMDDTMRLVLSRIMTDGRCRVCNAQAEEKQAELERQLEKGCCPVCGADPDVQDDVVAQHQLDRARLEKERGRAEAARREEETQLTELQELGERHAQALVQWEGVRGSIEERTGRNRRLRARLPATAASREYLNEVDRLRREHEQLEAKKKSLLKELRELVATRRNAITARSEELKDSFGQLVEALLVEKVRLRQTDVQPRYMEAPGPAEERVQVPAFVAEMTAAARPGFSERKDEGAVSESQRELIDLAFRLALVSVFGGAATFAMETPEASLDAVSMERVGTALARFASTEGSRLVVTSNLTNGGIVTAMFDATEAGTGSAVRLDRVLNLLDVALPNRALLEDRERYEELLERMVSGSAA